MRAATLFAAAVPALLQSVAALSTITASGRYLVDASGNRFFIKGVAYQPQGNVAAQTAQSQANGGFPEPDSFIDPLADGTACARDIPNLTKLGVNTIRVYSVNGRSDHSACMNAFNTAGIYVIADLALPLNGSINRAAPSWDTSLLNEYTVTLDNLAPFSNLLAVTVANEVVTLANNSVAAAYIKAAARDMKAYIKSKNYKVLTAYAAVDGGDARTELANYLACGSSDISIDIYGLNSYSGCGATSASAYSALVTSFANYPIPAFFSEFGCLTAGTRTWSEVPFIFGTASITDVFSGGCAFEYFADSQGLGLMQNTTTVDGPITATADFDTLATQYAAVTPSTTVPSGAAPANPQCASSANVLASSNLPPTPNQSVCTCLDSNAFGCVVKDGTTPAIVGALIDQACSLLGGVGGSCTPISSNGQTGTYGNYSSCDPVTKLNFVLSSYYTATNFQATSCDFGGNATVNSAAPTAASAAASVTAACLAGQPVGVFTPSSSPTATSGGSGNNNGGGSSSNKPSAASPLVSTPWQSMAGMAMMGCATLVAGAFLLVGA